ncbi:MAG: iron-containing alcohol dehydrogenase [Planctomycetaceae bacterium]|nr:iron-containing alcohol dehydrogenase [Planctomycetaceae bacterium]
MLVTPTIYDFVVPSRIVFGWGRRREVGALARSLGRRAFVVCGSRTLENGGELAAIITSLQQAGVETVRLESVSREPLVDDVDSAVARLRDHHAGAGDLLLAVGGGSAIDLAKAAGALVTNRQSETVRDFLEGVGRGFKIANTPLPLLAMPTTGGTGTEATKNAVISCDRPRFKKSLRSELMVPRIVLIDPELSVSVPPKITAWTGMDAITQLIESFVSNRANGITRNIAWFGLFGAVDALRAAFFDGRNQNAREKMARAAMYSGIALANSGLGMAHGVAAALGVHCNVPHGLACAVMLPVTMRANRASSEARRHLRNTSIAILGDSKIRVGEANNRTTTRAITLIERLAEDLNIPRRLSEIGVERAQIPEIVRDSRGNSMSGNPRDLSDAELTKILEDML